MKNGLLSLSVRTRNQPMDLVGTIMRYSLIREGRRIGDRDRPLFRVAPLAPRKLDMRLFRAIDHVQPDIHLIRHQYSLDNGGSIWLS